MTVANADIATVFDEIADLLELTDANPFRVRAYRNAAATVGEWPEPLATWEHDDRDFDDLPGIGEDLAAKIREILKTGSCRLLRKLRRTGVSGLAALLRVRGLGPKRIKALHKALGVHTPRQLLRAASAGRIRELRGFGPTSERRIGEALRTFLEKQARRLWAVASADAGAITEYLLRTPAVGRVMVAGSYRRMLETVGDLDFVVAADDGDTVTKHLAAYADTRRTLVRGPTRASIELDNGLQVDMRVVAADEFGAALLYFTGSRAHTIALRRIAQQTGLKLNEYGLFRGNRRIAGDSEASVYAALGLVDIPPELREDRGEIEAARKHRLPELIADGDLRGDLHVHTDASDGSTGLRQMAEAACAAGLEYIAITDHSRNLRIAHGLDTTRLARQIERIDELNGQLQGITLLKGIEVDILEDGSLDLPDSVLARLDLVVGAIHGGFRIDRRRQTERILRAMDRPGFSILAHPTGRLIGQRPPYDIDLQRIARHAQQRGCFLELNCHPQRVDLNDLNCRVAKDAGAMLAVSSDAHHPTDFASLHFGTGQARRGWLGKSDVLNTRKLKDLRALLAATMARSTHA